MRFVMFMIPSPHNQARIDAGVPRARADDCAVAVAMAFGAEAGLEIVDGLREAGVLDGYHLLPSVRGDLLAKLGRSAEAREELERAAAMTRNEQERRLLRERAARLA